MRIRALAVDVDGTITDERCRLDPRVVELIRELELRGVRVILASGNSLPILVGLSRYLGCSDGVVAENGAVVWYRGTKLILADRDIMLKARRIIAEKMSDWLQESWQNEFRFADFAFKLKAEVPVEEVLRRANELLRDLPAEMAYSGVAFHVRMKGVNKAVGLRKLLEFIGIDMSEVMAVGDGYTDLEMIREAGLGVALAHAPEEVRRAADYVTEKPFADGFIEAVKRFLLGEG